MGRYEGKTERATPQRRRKARSEGTVARSAEVATAGGLLAAVLALQVFVPAGIDIAATETSLLLRTAGEGLNTARLTDSALRFGVGVAGPFLAISVVAAIVAGVAQVGLRITPKAAQPKLSNLSLKKGLERFRPSAVGWELLRTALKLGLLAAVAWGPVRAMSTGTVQARSIDGVLTEVAGHVWTLLWRCVVLAIVIGAADYAWNKHKTEKQMKMSKDDVKREHKDTEGDPQLKASRRRRQSELSRNRMLRDVGLADVVVTNPTHLAVALRYDGGDSAPRVLAKGADHIAAKIRAAASRNGVPITEDRPLARALYRQCKIGQVVPGSLFEAVAVVLALAYRRRGRRPLLDQEGAA